MYISVSGLAVCIFSPTFVQKAVQITWYPKLCDFCEDSDYQTHHVANHMHVSSMISKIPYVENPGTVWAVHPREKFEKTIIQGDGNCSNLVFGAAWTLMNTGSENLSIVHFLPREKFLLGNGHSILSSQGLYDVLDGGFWMSDDGKLLRLRDLLQRTQGEDLSFQNLNNRRPTVSRRVNAKFLDNVSIGVVVNTDIANYFWFIENIYLSLNSPKFEKIFFDGLAMFFGFLPAIYVEDNVKVISGRYYPIVLYMKIWLHSLRLLSLIQVLLILKNLIFLFKKNFNMGNR